MSDTAIKFENVSKLYRLGTVGTGTLSHDIKRWWITSIRGKEDPYLKIGETNDRATKGSSDYVYALKDINLEVKQGDVLGIIGKNGAGKSTLLKLLSKVTAPTAGKIYTKGRIASLLEVGTGFHPELTGRENIYMNGTILGMKKWEIDKQLDEIVDFSGCERYLDTPVKRYSSGMTVRLGFAIAAHLNPDILVVDEVLAVGDAEFQKKAIGKMQDVSYGCGRTVLFVSHNMTAVRSLCKNGVVLTNGMVDYSGKINDCIDHYIASNMDVFSTLPVKDIPHEKRGNGKIHISDLQYLDIKGEETSPRCGAFIRIRITLDVKEEKLTNCNISLGIRDMFGSPLLTLPSHMCLDDFVLVKGLHHADLVFDKLPLAGGTYRIGIFCSSQNECADLIENVIRLEVLDDDYYGRGKSINDEFKGKVVLGNYNWEIC